MALLFEDTFTEASDTPITSHSPDIGDSWTEVFSNGSPYIVINAAANDARNSAALNSTGYIATADIAIGDADYDVEADVSAFDSGDNFINLFLRLTDSSNHYHVQMTTTSIYIGKNVAGTTTQLATTTGGLLANGDTVRFSVSGSSLELYNVTDSVSLLTATDSSITAIGKGALGMGGGAAVVRLGGDMTTIPKVTAFRLNGTAGGGGGGGIAASKRTVFF